MRFNVEYQRNIAFDLLEIKRRDIKFSAFFDSNIPVIIYGLDYLGKEIYYEIKDDLNVICMIDREHGGEIFDDVPVYSLNNEELKKYSELFEEIYLIISVVSDEKKILKDTIHVIPNVLYVPLYDIFAYLKIHYNKEFIKDQNEETINTINSFIQCKKTDIEAIVVVGTSYTLLLSMLYIHNWKKVIYVLERFVPPIIAERMKKLGLCCLYEKTSVDYYDICYSLARSAKEMNVPVFGHDHASISRAFIENDFTVIEDGLLNYDIKHALRYLIFQDNGIRYIPAGYSDRIKKVLLTGMDKIPNELIEKVEIIKPRELWRDLILSKRSELAWIMGFEYLNIFNEIKSGRDTILLTEPIVSAGEQIVSLENHIDLYSKVLSHYNLNSIIIKPHPSDKIDYNYFFPECLLIGRIFPVQLLDWADMGVKKFIIIENHERASCRNVFKDNYQVDIYSKTNYE